MQQRLVPAPTLLICLFALALGVRLAAGFWWQDRLPEGEKFGFPDSHSYWELAQSVRRGESYQFNEHARIFRTPGYPLLLAGFFWSVGKADPPVMWVRAMNAVLGTLAVGAVVWLAWQLFDRPTALLAGLLVAVSPETVAMSTFVLSEAPFGPLMVLHLIAWVAAWRSSSFGAMAALGVLAGALAGAATLVRPSWLLFVPFALTLAVIASPLRRRHALLGVFLLVGLIAAMLPWWARNYQVTGQFVATTLQVGASLYDGLNPQATGGSDMEFVADFYVRQVKADATSADPPVGTFEARLDRRLRDAALGWARDNPGRVVELMGIKLLRMWNLWPNAAELQSLPLRLAVMVAYAPLMLAGLWGVWLYARRGWPYVLCLLPAVYFTCLHLVFVSSIRYRQPALLTFSVLAAAGMVALWRRRGG